ncbi:MAG: xanthine dehydrogenase family protein subunit M [Hyphomicrobiaceae bacterium]
MKPPRFEYACPATLSEAVALLAGRNGNAKPMAGGQSLMPLLAFRLAQPELVVDLKRVQGLDRIEVGPAGLTLGAKVRWVDIERDERIKSAHPLLAEAVRNIAHYQIRNRGTAGGSLAHADPAAELPGIAVTCDAIIRVAGAKGERQIRAGDFFVGPLQTTLEPDEIITAVQFPAWAPGRRSCFLEFSRRKGDFALAGVGLYYDADTAGKAANAHVGVIGMGDRPRRLAKAEAALNGKLLDDATIMAAAAAASAEVEPSGDIHAGPEYRRALVGTLTERALRRAAA